MQITIDTTKFDLTKVSGQINYAMSNAINKTLVEAQNATKENFKRNIDNPTPFTISGVQFRKSTKQSGEGHLYIEKQRAAYMRYILFGGVRTPQTKSLRGVTKSTPLNKYGNLTKDKVGKLLANKTKYFSGKPKGNKGLPAGIYERMGRKGRVKIRPIIFWDDAFRYNKQLEFFEPVIKVFSSSFAFNFNKALMDAMRTAK